MFDIDERFFLSGNATPHWDDEAGSEQFWSLGEFSLEAPPSLDASLSENSEDLSLDEPLSEKGASSEEIKGVDTGRWIRRTVRQAKNNNVPVPRDIIRNEQN